MVYICFEILFCCGLFPRVLMVLRRCLWFFVGFKMFYDLAGGLCVKGPAAGGLVRLLL